MDVRQLAALVAIADHGTFSSAARALFTVQSNVSGRIAKLERELGSELVDRSSGALTDEGARVVERARRILRELDDIVTDLGAPDQEVAGQARIGSIGTTARWLLPILLGAVERDHPGVHPIIVEGSTSALIPHLLSGRIDAAIVHLPVDDPELVFTPLFAEDLLMLTSRDHPLASRGEISIAELAGLPLLLPPKGSALRRVLDRAAAAHDVTLVAQAEIDGVRLLASLVFDGYGATIVPATAAPTWYRGEFGRVSVQGLPKRVVSWVTRRRPPANAATRAVQAQLLDLLPVHAPAQPGIHLGDDTFPLSAANSPAERKAPASA